MISEIIQSNQDRFLLVSGERTLCAPYMLKMLHGCGCPCLLPLRYSKDEEHLYDILHGISLESYIQKKGFTPQLLINLLYSLKAMMRMTNAYLLDARYIVLDAQYIYLYDHDQFRYIFNPYREKDLNTELKGLIKSLIEGNYTDKLVLEACEQANFDLQAVIQAVEGIDLSLCIKESMQEESVTLKNILDIDDCITIKNKDISVGRGCLINNKKLPGQLASLRHACLRYARKTLYVKDFNSKNGTYINGERIKAKSFLKADKGDIIAFGDDEYIVV